MRRREDQVVGRLASRLFLQPLDQQPRHRQPPRLVRLRRAQHDPAVDLRHGLADLDPAATEVDAVQPQHRDLIPTEPAVAERQHQNAIATAVCSPERATRAVSQVAPWLRLQPWQVDTGRSITHQTAVLPHVRRPGLAGDQGTGSVWREAAGGRPCRQRSAGGTW